MCSELFDKLVELCKSKESCLSWTYYDDGIYNDFEVIIHTSLLKPGEIGFNRRPG